MLPENNLQTVSDIQSPIIRKAVESDRYDIALCIAEGFKKDFSFFCKNPKSVANALVAGIRIERFYIAEKANETVAVAGISDHTGRAVYTDYHALCKYFGWIKGSFAKLVLKPEFERALPYPSGTGFIEFVAVKAPYRRQGIATDLLLESMKIAAYSEYILDVIAENIPAMNCYRKIGFQEIGRDKARNKYAKVYMRKRNSLSNR